MKKLILIIVLLSLSTVAHAGEEYHSKKKIVKNYTTNNYSTTNVDSYENEFGAKLDAPYLVQLSENWYVGVEGGKDLYETNADQGWFGYGKVTYTGTLFSFVKK